MAKSELSKSHFQDANAARLYLEANRWPNGPICPHCGVIGDHYAMSGNAHRPGLWKCAACRKQFSVTVGTVFERSKIPLNLWLQAVYLLCSSKKGFSSLQLQRTLGVTYKTAWFMTHRIREAMKTPHDGQLGGSGKIVEADETYIGTEEGSKSKRSGERTAGGGAMSQMNKVFTLVEREGAVRSFHVTDVTGENLKRKIIEQVHPDTHLMTDSSNRYNELKRAGTFARYDQVNHSKDEYVRGIAYTNTVEGYFSVFKRGMMGVYHNVSSKHLHRYMCEYDFRYNNRSSQGVEDTERTDMALKGIGGKRLTYRRTHS